MLTSMLFGKTYILGVDVLKRLALLVVVCSMFFVVTACASNKIVLSDNIPDFVQESDFENINWENKAVKFGDDGKIIGNENKSGVIGADMPSLNGQKWMWHLWGVDEAELTVIGLHKKTNTVHQILTDGWTKHVSGANNGADSHAPSSVKIPKPGEWAILLYTNGEFFDTLIYEINE